MSNEMMLIDIANMIWIAVDDIVFIFIDGSASPSIHFLEHQLKEVGFRISIF